MKAITPVIATIVLLLITVAIAGAAWTYISGYWSGTTGKQIEVTDAFCVGTNQAKIIVKNIGTNPIRTGDIAILDKNSGSDITGDVQWMSEVADSSLVLELRFDEGSGTVAADTSGNGNDCTLFNGSETCYNTLSTPYCPVWVEGRIGGALGFDGVGDYVDCGNGGSLDMGYSDFTLSLWMLKGHATGSMTDSILSRGLAWNVGGPASEGYVLRLAGTVLGPSSLGFAINNGSTTDTRRIVGVSTPEIGKWMHIAVVADRDAAMSLYLNGTVRPNAINPSDISDISSSDINGSFRPFLIGIENYAIFPFNGTLDEIRIYNRALSPDEVKALAENSVLVQPGGTVTLTHTCGGRCDYRVLLGGMSRTVSVQC